MKRFDSLIRWSIALVALVVLLGAAPVHAEQWLIPASANVAGSAGTNWRTDLRLVNTEDEATTARIYLLEAGLDNGALSRHIDVNLPADGQVQLENILGDRFLLSGTAALLVEAPGDDLVVTSRTYNQVPGGTYGQFIPGVPVSDALAAGEDAYLVYLAKSGDFRTNLGWAGTSSASSPAP